MPGILLTASLCSPLLAELMKHSNPLQHLATASGEVCLIAHQGDGCSMQGWEDAKPNQTAVPFEKEYYVRGTRLPVFKQNVGMFKLRNGVEVHFQSFGIFNLTLWDDVMTKFMPLSKNDTVFVGEPSPLRPALLWWLRACDSSIALCADRP